MYAYYIEIDSSINWIGIFGICLEDPSILTVIEKLELCKGACVCVSIDLPTRMVFVDQRENAVLLAFCNSTSYRRYTYICAFSKCSRIKFPDTIFFCISTL